MDEPTLQDVFTRLLFNRRSLVTCLQDYYLTVGPSEFFIKINRSDYFLWQQKISVLVEIDSATNHILISDMIYHLLVQQQTRFRTQLLTNQP